MANSRMYDVAIVGGGIAGLSLALRLPESMRVALFTKGQLGESNTRYAQGGLAVALGADDSPELHFQDTLAAGAGLCNEEAVRILVEQAPTAVKWLIEMGVQFDRVEPGSDAHTTEDGLLLGREAAHSRWRVLHAGGDATGAEIEQALLNVLKRRSSLTLYEETFVSNLLVQDDICSGVEAIDRHGQVFTIESRATILANGGAGGLWLHTSNPLGATADGLALAWRAGAALTDLEFMQFHPTVLAAGNSSHLISEAVRGEGAYLRNHAGERFMLRYAPQAELAPRDVVARAILSEMLAEKTDCQYLDLRHLPAEKMHARFPTISAICSSYGLDLARDLVPVAPAAHYCMGGVMVDTYGRTSLAGLYAVGEVACTGVHGANRLASNSLLEGLVFGLRVADGLVEGDGCVGYSVGAGVVVGSGGDACVALGESTMGDPRVLPQPHAAPAPTRALCASRISLTTGDPRVLPQPHSTPAPTGGPMALGNVARIRREVRGVMWQYVSLCRDEEGLLEAKRRIDELGQSMSPTEPGENGEAVSAARWTETCNMLQVAELVITAALLRRESRGSHWRRDYEALDEGLAHCHFVFVNDPTSPSRATDCSARATARPTRETDCPSRATARVRPYYTTLVAGAGPAEEVIAHA